MQNLKWNIQNLCSEANCDCKILGDKDVRVSGLQINSSDVLPGDAFFCTVGLKTDGHKFAKDAVERGASVLFVEHEIANLDVCQVVVENTRSVMPNIAKTFYGNPTDKMKIVGITGTNGKTTASNIVAHVLLDNNIHNGLVGTVGIKIDGSIADNSKFRFAGRTTPEAFQLQRIMYEFLNMGIKNVIMEVSSHAISQGRIDGISFEVTAFTNLTQDHLDFHKTMEDYFQAKAQLFTEKFVSKRVVCIDDNWGIKIYNKVKNAGDDVISVGLHKDADYNLDNVKSKFKLIGKFNKQNMLVAFGICKQLGINEDKIISALNTMPEVEGRMQAVNVRNNKFKIFVDYCHTPDALENVLLTLKEECRSRLITVFGCGGDRDKDKRPKMGKISAENSDYVIVTSDNPRTENPELIIEDIVAGMNNFDNYEKQIDRKMAIQSAIKLAKEDDVVLIAGKGHEKYQEINGEKIDFDDVKIAEEALNSTL